MLEDLCIKPLPKAGVCCLQQSSENFSPVESAAIGPSKISEAFPWGVLIDLKRCSDGMKLRQAP